MENKLKFKRFLFYIFVSILTLVIGASFIAAIYFINTLIFNGSLKNLNDTYALAGFNLAYFVLWAVTILVMNFIGGFLLSIKKIDSDSSLVGLIIMIWLICLIPLMFIFLIGNIFLLPIYMQVTYGYYSWLFGGLGLLCNIINGICLMLCLPLYSILILFLYNILF